MGNTLSLTYISAELNSLFPYEKPCLVVVLYEAQVLLKQMRFHFVGFRKASSLP
jgi:hypothetical protein